MLSLTTIELKLEAAVNCVKMDQFDKTGNSIYNDEIRFFIGENISQWFQDEKAFSSMGHIEEYLETFVYWLASSTKNKLTGINSFPNKHAGLGVTEALDQFHARIQSEKRRLRIFRGEYPYSRDVLAFSYDTGFVDDFPLEKEDALILSCPFSGSGSKHPKMEKILDECLMLKVPVFLDMAWFGTCGGLEVDLSHPAISEVAFSLTKGLTCGNYRSGMRLTRAHANRRFLMDRMELKNQWNHSIQLNLKIGTELMRNFSPDTQYLKYRDLQLQICKEEAIDPSLCVHIATSPDPKWNDFSRDGYCNRLNLRRIIKLARKSKKRVFSP